MPPKSAAGDSIGDYGSAWEYIQADPERLRKHTERTNKYRKATRQWLADYKTGHGCIDCGFALHFAALQLDHLGPKTADIGELRSSTKRIQKEIEDGQCVVRCANCHAIKTWHDRNGLEYIPSEWSGSE